MDGQRPAKTPHAGAVPHIHYVILGNITDDPGAAGFYAAIRPYPHSVPSAAGGCPFDILTGVAVPDLDLRASKMWVLCDNDAVSPTPAFDRNQRIRYLSDIDLFRMNIPCHLVCRENGSEL